MADQRAGAATFILLCLIGCAEAPAPIEDASGGDGGSPPPPPPPCGELPPADYYDAASRVLPAPDRVGGDTTLREVGEAPFLTPMEADRIPDLFEFSSGRELFVADWVEAPGQREVLDGLGPLFIARSCLQCHPALGRPPSLEANGTVRIGLFLRLAGETMDGAWVPDLGLGSQLQTGSLPSYPAEATLTWRPSLNEAAPYSEVARTSPRPVFVPEISPGHPSLSATTRWGPRLSPQLVGLGLLEAVPDAEILRWEDACDADGDGISGRAAYVERDGKLKLGRFGWKAINVDLAEQAAGAFAGDIGITSPLQPTDDCTPYQIGCDEVVNGGDPEISLEGLRNVVVFMRHLGVPPARRVNDDPTIARGARLFADIGCAKCHRPELVTAVTESSPFLSEQTLFPYTDLLLHDMGPGLADGIGEGDAAPSEWRTPPLWGLGLVEAQDHARFLHDGRATSLSDAISWHGGEADEARAEFATLDDQDAEALLAFLRSL